MERHFGLLIIDLDGTAIANRENAMPSARLISAIKAAQEITPISVATGRPITNSREILRTFGLKTPCIISGGTQIIDPQTETTLWEKRLDETQVRGLVEALDPYPYVLLFGEELLSDSAAVPAKEKTVNSSERVAYLMAVKEEELDEIMGRIKSISQVAAHAVPSWTKGQRDIHITHEEATKEHALAVLLEMLNIRKEDAMAVGDSSNDLPLFRGVGYKVAMGNATEDLKAESDYITASVEDDGLAQVIEKKILHTLK